MKVLVATNEKQGVRTNDFNNCKEGELVRFGSECDRGYIDDKCGCKRAMVGMDSSLSTTTFKVVDTTLSYKDYIHRIKDSYVRGGWGKILKNLLKVAEEDANELLEMAKYFELNDILEKRGENVQARN